MKEITRERINEVVDKVGEQIVKDTCKEYAKLLLQNEREAREQASREVLSLKMAQQNCASAIKEVLYELLVS